MRKLILINGLLEYSYKVFDNARHYLYYSRLGKQWTEKAAGKCAVKLVNHGNGVVISFENKTFELDYCEVQALQIMLTEFTKHHNYGKVKSLKVE